MLNNFIRVLIIIFAAIFSIACGLFLVRFASPIYFKLFSPLSQTLKNFYMVIGGLALIVILLDVAFLKIGKYNWAILISGSTALLYCFGIPIFMLENNEMLWREAVLKRLGPVYFIEFSDQTVSILNNFRNLYWFIWDKVYLYVFAYIIIFLAGYLGLRKLDCRIKGIKIR